MTVSRLGLVFVFAYGASFAPGCSNCGGPAGGEGEGEGAAGEGEGEGAAGEGEGEGPTRVTCDNMPAVSPGADVCAVTAGTGGIIVMGELLLPGQLIENGGVSIDDDGTISCVGCDCITQAAARTQIVCPDAVISPGFINAHDHAGWMNDVPWVPGTNETPIADVATRWEQRHDWREGKRGNPKIKVGGGATKDDKALGELRFVLGGATATNASGGFGGPAGDGSDGFLRNLDNSTDMGAIGAPFADYQTFPLNDSNGTQLETGCVYKSTNGTPVPPLTGPASAAFTPHISEGIDAVAHNEFVCLSSDTIANGADVINSHTAIIHGVGLLPADVALMAQRGTSLIWSPRSNVSLYGDTAQIPLFKNLGVNIALGTDWIPSGSMNLLRELSCVISLNGAHFGGVLTDEDMWRMVTINGAQAMLADGQLGVLALGHRGDIAVFAKSGKTDYRAAIESTDADVALVLKDGKPMSGNPPVVSALDSTCEPLDVCGAQKLVCAVRETGLSLTALQAGSSGGHYALDSCDTTPADEPTCDPSRSLASDVVNSSTTFTGVDGADDQDGDGIADADDNCPTIFNPIRPLDNGAQGDADGDGVGDVCDPCPLDADTTVCQTFNTSDRDGDGVDNTADNCPDDANADQADGDHDGKGDVCDACPADANAGTAGCPLSIYAIKASDPATIDGTAAAIPELLVVTAVDAQGYFVQVDADEPTINGTDNSCAFVFQSGGTKPAAGDRIHITTTKVSNFFDEIELGNASFTVVSSGALPTPTALSASDVTTAFAAGARSPLEGCLAGITTATVTNATPAPGAGEHCGAAPLLPCNEFEVDGGLRVDDVMFLISPQPTAGAVFPFINGALQFKNGLLKLLPRDQNDVAQGPPALAAVEPALSFVRLNATNASTFPVTLAVRMDRATAAGPTTVLVSSDSAHITVPVSVDVAANATTATVLVTSDGTASTATISARLLAGDPAVTAQVQSLADDAPATAVSIAPSPASVGIGSDQVFTVTFDVPAPTAGASMTVAVAPLALGTAATTVPVTANAQTATFRFTGGAAAATGTVAATLGATVTADVSVVTSTTPFISEIDYDQPGSAADSAEFFEMFNPTSAAFDLAGVTVVLVNGSNLQIYGTVTINAGSIPANGRVVIGNVPGALLPLPAATNALQNGPKDAIAVLDATGALIDGIVYEASAPLTFTDDDGVDITISESVSTSDPGAGSLCGTAQGVLAACATSTPGT